MKNIKPKFALIFALCLVESIACADSLELKNGSLIEGKFVGGTDSEISFQVASSVQKYNLGDRGSSRRRKTRQLVQGERRCD